jgi:serine/threonine protein phosphatase 1
VGRTVIIGDIHGCYEELVQLIDVAGVRDEDLLLRVEPRGPITGLAAETSPHITPKAVRKIS